MKIRWLSIFPAVCVLALVAAAAAPQKPAAAPGHPNTAGWADLFESDLSDADYPAGIWTFADGILTASQDQCIWTKKDYSNFVLDLEFRTAPGTNSGVIVYCSDSKDWIPNSVEIQIADDFADE
jgi:hypothetical protein